MKKILAPITKIQARRAAKRYDAYIKEMQDNIGPYVPTPHVAQVWA